MFTLSKSCWCFAKAFYSSVPLELWFFWSPPGGSPAASGEYWPFPSLCWSQHSSSRTFASSILAFLIFSLTWGCFLFRQLIQSSSNVLTHYLIPKSYKALAIVELLADDWFLIWLLTHLGTFPWGAWVWVLGRSEAKGIGGETPILGSQVDIQYVVLNTVC